MSGTVIQREPRRVLPAGPGRGPGAVVSGAHAPLTRCAVPGCGVPIDSSRLMCRGDWYAVPRPLRDRVWATWRSGLGAGAPEHRESVRLAIQASQALRPAPDARQDRPPALPRGRKRPARRRL